MRLTINLATRRYINTRRLNASLAVAFFLLAALLLYKVREIGSNQAELNQIARQSAAADRGPAAAPEISPAQLQAQKAKIATANALIDRKTINWVGLLDNLEQVVPGGVAMTQVTPNLREQSLAINGVAQSFANLKTLLENMEQSPNFSEVYLVNQAEVTVGKTQHGLSFAISCKVNYR